MRSNPPPLRNNGPKTMARDVHIDHEGGQLFIDGIRLPWWIAEPEGPTLQKLGEAPVHAMTFSILVEGQIIISDANGSRRIDPVLGDVSEYARRLVREEFAKAYPDLELPE